MLQAAPDTFLGVWKRFRERFEEDMHLQVAPLAFPQEEVSLSIHLSIYPSIHPSIYLSIYGTIYLYATVFLSLSTPHFSFFLTTSSRVFLVFFSWKNCVLFFRRPKCAQVHCCWPAAWWGCIPGSHLLAQPYNRQFRNFSEDERDLSESPKTHLRLRQNSRYLLHLPKIPGYKGIGKYEMGFLECLEMCWMW